MAVPKIDFHKFLNLIGISSFILYIFFLEIFVGRGGGGGRERERNRK